MPKSKPKQGVRKIPVNIAGHSITVKTDAEDEYILELANEIEDLVTQLKKGQKTYKDQAVLLLACLSFANERAGLAGEKKQLESETQQLKAAVAAAEGELKRQQKLNSDSEGRLAKHTKEVDRLKSLLASAKDRSMRATHASVEQTAKMSELKKQAASECDRARKLDDRLGKVTRKLDKAEARAKDLGERLKETETRSRQAATKLVSLEDTTASLKKENAELGARLEKALKQAADTQDEKEKALGLAESAEQKADAAAEKLGEIEGRTRQTLSSIIERVDSAVGEIQRLKNGQL